MIRTGITRIAAGLALVGTIAAAGFGVGTNAAHAAQRTMPCIQVSCIPLPPTLSVTSGLGEVSFTGTHWTNGQWFEVTIYAPVSSNLPPISYMATQVGPTGTFTLSYVAPNRCFTQQMEFQYTVQGDPTTYTVLETPGCLRHVRG